MEEIIIKNVSALNNQLDIDFCVSSNLRKYFDDSYHFFCEYSCNIDDVPKSVLVIPAVLNFLPLSWLTDTVVWVDEIDAVFYERISRIKAAFSELYPNVKMKGSFIAARIIENSYSYQNKALQLFTGGVDATTTYYRIKEKNPILFNVNGWYLDDITQNEVYDADRKAITDFANSRENATCFARSNFARFIKADIVDKHFRKETNNTWWFGFQHSLAFLGCAVVAGYHYKVENLYIASSYTFGQNVICVSDPRIDNLISCAAMNTIHDGYELSRQEKVKYLVACQKESCEQIPLRVCSFHASNCCECEKCLRTMLAIAAEGGSLEAFGFDLPDGLLSTVRKFLDSKITELDANHIVFWNDIISRMEDNSDIVIEQDVLMLLKDYPFEEKKKKWLRQYYKKNFWSILKRKIFK